MALENARGHQSLNVAAAFSGIAALVVLLRLYTRCFVVRSLGVEDYFICLSLLCAIGFTITIGIQVQYGMGRHVWTIDPEDNRESLKAFYASLLVYNMSLSLTKASILLQYRRVFPTRKFRIACWIVIGVVFVYTLWTIFGNVFQCIPVSAFWTLDPGAWCMDQIASWFTNAALNIVTDLAIIILPMPVIRTLNLERSQKQLLAAIFAVGGFVCIVSILRLQSLAVISNSKDVTYDNPPAATWSSVEVHVGIICSCLPCLRPLLARLFPRFFRGTTYRHNTARNAPPIYSRRAYGRHSSDIDFVLSEIEKETKGKRGSMDSPMGHRGRDDVIEVITEVHVSVDNRSEATTPIGKTFMLEDGRSSTEDLFRDARNAV